MSEVKTELHRLLQEDDLENVHLLIFANKQDVENAMSTTEIREELGLNDLKKRSWFVQPTCATKAEGLTEGLDWLANQIQNRPRFS
jgi:signal recognition particle receptor subunit beta